ncbi:ATPase family AAA domain-containing protein 5 [Chanos chanos]|uniref:ATPase family AAA domain-containing protein 5 n=1 Tax=Chanos chanos TaxID=29144 RepID=A0A6J2WQ74_CHACN|nr:ATPase family AAA domain-containing protein 5 [Chanos chanos]
MAGVVAMASVMEDFEVQPCKKPRKEDDLPAVKTITNYFMPVPKAVEKSFSPTRSNNIMDYFRKTPPAPEKNGSPQSSKENCLVQSDTPNRLEKSVRNRRTQRQERGRKSKGSCRRLEGGDAAEITDDVIVIENSDEAKTVGSSTTLGSDTAALLAEISGDMCMDNRETTTETSSDDGKVKNRLLSRQQQNKVDTSPQCSTASEEKPRKEKSAVKKGRKGKGSQQEPGTSIPEDQPSEQSLCNASLEVNVDETSQLNSSTVTVSFEDFLLSQSQEEAGAVTPEPAGCTDADTFNAAGPGEDGRGVDPPALQVSPRTLTIQAEVHPISPGRESAGMVDLRVASIFTRNRKDRKTAERKPASCTQPQASPDLVLDPKRKSNVVLQETDLELDVVESSSAPKCSQAERMQFMNAFKQPSLDGSKGKASKSQGRQKQAPEKTAETGENEPGCQGAQIKNNPTSSSEQEGEQKNTTGKRRKTVRKSSRKAEESVSEEVQDPASETENLAPSKEADTVCGSADGLSSPSGRELRRSTRELSRRQALSTPETNTSSPKTDVEEKLKESAGAKDVPVLLSTPKTHRSKKGMYSAEILSPLDVKGSPIRMKFTRVFPTSATKSGDYEISSPLPTQGSYASKKRKQAKKLVEKAKAIQNSKQSAAEERTPLRRSLRRQDSVRKIYCEDEDSVVFLEEAQSNTPQSPSALDKGKSPKPLRSLNEVLGKNTPLQKAAKNPAASKVAPLFGEKKGQRPSTVISIFDDNSREGSENSQDDEQFRAKRDFLKSGLPESFKKQIAKTAASREAYSASCASFQTVVHVLQPPADCSLWSLAWPGSSRLSTLKESWHLPSTPLPHVKPLAVANTVPAQRRLRERVSGWREDFSEPVRQSLLEEINTSNPSFPVCRIFPQLMKRRAEQTAQAAAPETGCVSGPPRQPAEPEPVGGKRKRVDEGEGRQKVAKKQRSGQSEDDVITIADSPPAQETPDSEPPKRGRRSRSLRHKEQAKLSQAAVTSSKDPPIVLDSPASGNDDTEDGAKEDVLWTEKYQPQRSGDVVGNTASVRKLHSWLKEWKLRADREERKKQQEKRREGDANDSWHPGDSDEGAEEGEDLLCNTLLITGPTGVGKTAAVYACAQELGFKVFEVNSASQRSGRQILSQLKEATQSHQVDIQGVNAHKPTYFNSYNYTSSSAPRPGTSPRKVNSPRRVVSSPRKAPHSPRGATSRRGGLAPTSLASFFKMGGKPTAKDAGSQEKKAQTNCPKKSAKETSTKSKGPDALPSGSRGGAEEQSKKTATSLILFEEVDVVFDDDSGFLAAIKTFMTTTKRPVILTTSDPTFGATFDGSFEEIQFKTPSVMNIASYLRLICLAENVRTDGRDVSSLVSWNRCDIRKSLLHLQFWACSGGAQLCSHRPASPASCTDPQTRPESECGVEDSSVHQTDRCSAGEPVLPVSLPICDTGVTESWLGFLNIQPKGGVQHLFKSDSTDELDSIRCGEMLAETRRRGVDLFYSNMESLLPLPTRPLPPSVLRSQSAPKPIPEPSEQCLGAPHLAEPSDDASPVKVSSGMKRKRRLCLDKEDLFQSDSDSGDGFLSLPKPGGLPALGADAQPEGEPRAVDTPPPASQPAPGRRSRGVLSAAEKKRSEPVSRCLSSMAEFLDQMSFLDSSLQYRLQQTEGACRPHDMGRTGAEVKSGMTDDVRLDCDVHRGRVSAEEIHTVLETLSFRRCRAGVSEAWSHVQELEEEQVRQEAVEEVTLPVADHRQGFSLTEDTLCEPRLLESRGELTGSVLNSRAFGTLGNRAALVLDYLPCLRTICRAERQKEQGKTKRRFLHYLDGIHLALPRGTTQLLASDFP